MEGHNALVTSVIVVPASSLASKDLCFCWTASLDGTIRYWDFSAPELRKTINCNMPIYSMVSWVSVIFRFCYLGNSQEGSQWKVCFSFSEEVNGMFVSLLVINGFLRILWYLLSWGRLVEVLVPFVPLC